MKTITIIGKDDANGDIRQSADASSLGLIGVGADGKARLFRQMGAVTHFELLPAATIAVSSDLLTKVTGTGSEVIARSDKGGVNLKSQASTPADGDNAFFEAAPNSAFIHKMLAANRIRFSTRVAIGSTADDTMFASIGLNENVTDVDPTGTAGEGAMFLYDPTKEVTTGLTTAQHLNWILAHKVNGADTFTDTGVLVVPDQSYTLEIVQNEDLTCSFSIDGVLVGTGPVLTSGDTVKVFGGVELTATPAGQADMDIRFLSLTRQLE